jgi:nucleotide-binding universal stress UspA family protein/RimJ/RimL family protein N-acetyltransferase
MSTASRRRTITLRDGARVTLRPIAPDDSPLLAASFERLSEESRYRRFFTIKDKLSAAELEYFVDVDHSDHEAIVAIDPSSGGLLGVARYIRSPRDAELAEVAVTVADDWQGRGLGRSLLDRLTYRARREGVRRFSALVQSENRASLGLLDGVGDTRRRLNRDQVELVIELPPKRGMGARLTRALRAAATGTLVPAQTLAHRVAVGVGSSPRPHVRPGFSIHTVVVGADGSESGAKTLAAAVRLAAALGAELHVVSARSAPQAPSDPEAALTAATQAARAEGLEAVTHARDEDPPEALIAVAEAQDADLLVLDSRANSRAARLRSGGGPDDAYDPPCNLLIVRTRE